MKSGSVAAYSDLYETDDEASVCVCVCVCVFLTLTLALTLTLPQDNKKTR